MSTSFRIHDVHWNAAPYRIDGALVGAAVYRLLQFYLDRFFGEASSFLLGLVYVVLVLFVPFGIVGTWRAKSPALRQWVGEKLGGR